MRGFLGVPAGVVALVLSCQAPLAAASLTVSTDNGIVKGRAIPGGTVYEGIPFAAPPVGALRWRVAQPARPWSGVLDATQFGPVCPQPPGSPSEAGAVQSEDCLTLNVLIPDHPAKGRLPVLVSVHGGAFFVGSGRDPIDKGVTDLVRQGIIVVAMNYRLGRLGFLAHPALTREAAARGEAGTNFWLSDQVAALQWVSRNIARFGGDPGQVAILGCSAGGSSINSLMVTPASRGLFVRASTHSGGGLFNASRPLSVGEQQGLEFGVSVGAPGPGDDALSRMRSLTVEQILAADKGPPNFGAVVDGRLLPMDISVAFAKGAIAQVPFAVGSTDNEASVFGLMGFDRTVLKSRFGVDLDQVRPAYETRGKLDEKELLRQVQTDFIFTSGSVGLATLAARGTHPVYAYHFTYVPAAKRASEAGAPHCADMRYIFEDAPKDDPEGVAVHQRLAAYWGNFIRTGNPNGPGLPAWPRFQQPDPAVLVLGKEAEPHPDFRKTELTPWFGMWAERTGDKIEP